MVRWSVCEGLKAKIGRKATYVLFVCNVCSFLINPQAKSSVKKKRKDREEMDSNRVVMATGSIFSTTSSTAAASAAAGSGSGIDIEAERKKRKKEKKKKSEKRDLDKLFETDFGRKVRRRF